MCKCGCNTCETKSTLMLNESLAPRAILSEGLKYHIDNNKPLTEHLYRAGSRAYFDLISEARSLYSRGILEFTNEDDLAILTETDLGHFGMFEGKKVPLDFPIELNEQMDIYDEIANMEFGMDYDQLGDNEKEWVRDEIDNMNEELTIAGKKVKTIHKNDSNNVKDHEIEYEDGTREPYLKHIIKEAFSGFLRNPEDPDSEPFNPTGSVAEFKEDLRALFGKFKGDLKNPEFIKGVAQIMVNWKSLLRSQLDKEPVNEYNQEELLRLDLVSHRLFDKDYKQLDGKEKDKAEKEAKMYNLIKEVIEEAKKNTKKLNKPMRDSSGGKAYKVYVKDPKTKKIKTVRFGSGGLRAKINDKKARNAFAKRHKCSTKKDKTKAGYWSCRLPRYAKLLGLKSNFGGFW